MFYLKKDRKKQKERLFMNNYHILVYSVAETDHDYNMNTQISPRQEGSSLADMVRFLAARWRGGVCWWQLL